MHALCLLGQLHHNRFSRLQASSLQERPGVALSASLLQARLVAATSAAASADGRVEDLQQRLAAAAVRRAREVAAARAAGEVQLQTLQDAVQRLGQRDEMAGQVCRAIRGLLRCLGEACAYDVGVRATVLACWAPPTSFTMTRLVVMGSILAQQTDTI